MFKTDNSLHVFVGPQETSSIGAASAGDVFIVDENNAIISDGAITSAAHPGLLAIGQKDASGNVRFSPRFKFANIVSKVAKADVARTEQSSVFGFSGSTGSMENINSNRYTLRVNFKNNVDMYSNQSDLHFFEFVSDANATEIEIADYFAQIMSKNAKFSGKASGKDRASVRVDRLLGGAGTDCASIDSGNLATAAVRNGSTHVACGSISADIISGGVAVGNYIRFDEAAGSTDDQSEPVYKIVEANATGNYIVLDQPYQGADADLEDDDCFIVTAADAASDAAGIRLVGLVQDWKLGLIRDAGSQITFDLTLDGWGDTTAVATTAAVKGSGHPQEVADLEWFAQGSAGAPYRHGTMPNNADLITLFADGASTTYYNTLELQVELEDPKYAVAGAGKGRATIIMAALDGASQSLVTTALATTGDAWN